MPTEEQDQAVARSAAAAAQELASGREQQRLRVQALAGDGWPDRTDLSAVLGEMDIAHEELRVAEEELRLQQRRLDQLLAERGDPGAWRTGLIGALPVPTLVTDLAGTVVDLNPAAWAALGLRRDEIRDRPLTDLVDPACTDAVLRVLEDVAADGATHRVRISWAGSTPEAAVELVVRADVPGSTASTATWVAVAGPRTQDDHETGLRTAEAFAEMCRLPLRSGADTRMVLAGTALLVERALPASDGVSITLGSPAAPDTQATDNVWAQAVDGAQLRAGQGPCVTAYRTGTVQVCEDLGADDRWPDLAALALPLGVRAVLASPLRTDRHSVGVLNVYARSRGAFTDRDRQVADLLSSAVLAVVQETRDRRELTELADQLREALESRGVIDQAKGMLMSRDGVDADTAFAQLVAVSRRANVKVRDVARALVDGGRGRTGRPGPEGPAAPGGPVGPAGPAGLGDLGGLEG